MKTASRLQRPLPWLFTLVLAARMIAADRLGAQMTPAEAVGGKALWGDPYYVTGNGIGIGVFEAGGRPNFAHPRLKTGTGAATLVSKTQDALLRDHACGVVGIIGANAGGGAATTGIARGSTLYLYSHTSAESNLESFFNNFFRDWVKNDSTLWHISNHSYGTDNRAGWDSTNGMWYWYGLYGTQGKYGEGSEDPQFGWYGPLAQAVDAFTSLATTQILVFSAGNFNSDGPSPGTTTYRRKDINGNWQTVNSPVNMPPRNGGADSLDCLEGFKTAKNAIMVGSLNYNSGTKTWRRSSFSSAGPTDDGRIKPDVMAYGGSITALRITGTAIGSGTSYAAPAVSAVLAQLAELWKGHGNPQPMLSSTARVLLCHTAKELGRPGPDYHFGWGLVDGAKAGDMILARENSNGFLLQERTLKNNVPDTIYIKAKADASVKVTIAWTDRAATPLPTSNFGVPPLNDRTSRLVNDLDLRIHPVTGVLDDKVTSPRMPWRLNPNKPLQNAVRDDNTVDNIEQVTTTAPSVLNSTTKGVFLIVVKNDKSLATSSQVYSIAISGADEYFPAPRQLAAQQTAGTSSRVTWRKVANAANYDVEYRAVGTVQWKSKGSVTLAQADFTNFAAGGWQVRVRARRGSVVGMWSDPASFIVGQPPVPAGLSATFVTSSTALLQWNKVEGATGYRVAYAPVRGDGSTLLIDDFIYKTTTEPKFNVGTLPADEYILWYVQTLAAPNGSEWAEGDMFATTLNCTSYEPDNNDYPEARQARIGEYFRGLICKNDEVDLFRIDPSESYEDGAIRVHFDPHSRPYTVRLWRLDKQQGGFTYSIVPNTSATLSPTQERVITHNDLDFYRYDYWVAVSSTNPATVYNESEYYGFWIETKVTKFPAGQEPAGMPGMTSRDTAPSATDGDLLQRMVAGMAVGK